MGILHCTRERIRKIEEEYGAEEVTQEKE